MVAETVTQKDALLKAAENLLVVLKVNEKGIPTNFAEWLQGIHHWVATVDHPWALDPDGNIMVPSDQLSSVLAMQSASDLIQARAKKRNVVKIEGSSGVKIEESESKETLSGLKEPKPSSSDLSSSSSSSDIEKASSLSKDELLKKMLKIPSFTMCVFACCCKHTLLFSYSLLR